MRFDPNRRSPELVRCTEMRCHDGPCRHSTEDAQDWEGMINMESYRCDYMFVPREFSMTGAWSYEGRDD